MTELDPAAIRHQLEYHREKGTPFDRAWSHATNYHKVSDDDRTLYAFMRKNFKAAYEDDKSAKGRCLVPGPETSNALLMARPHVPPVDGCCRSGDGCDRPAVRGRFGDMWCEAHALQLERVAAVVGKRGRGMGQSFRRAA